MMPTTIRSARPTDEVLPRVVAGRDAAPAEWEDWAEEPGHDLVAEEYGAIVGAIHVSVVGRTEAWMERLRVVPEFQGRGIAGQLVREAEHHAINYGAAKVRTAIPAHDYAALGVAQRAGYHRVLECVVLQTPLTEDPQHVPYDAPVESPGAAAVGAVAAFFSATQTLQGWDQLLPLGWRFRRIVPELIRGLIKDKRALVALRADALRPGVRSQWQAADLQGALLSAEHEEDVVISLVEGTGPAVQALFGVLAERATQSEVRRATVFAPTRDALAPLRSQEWTAHPWCPDGLVVVEKSVAS